MKRILILGFCVCWVSVSVAQSEPVKRLTSPGGSVVVRLKLGEDIRYSVLFQGKSIVVDAPLSLSLVDGQVLGYQPQLLNARQHQVNRELRPEVRVKNEIIQDTFVETVLAFEGGYRLIFRAYDDAVAYRWVTEMPGTIQIKDEQVSFNLASDANVYFPEEMEFLTHSERLYKILPLSTIKSQQFCSLPVLLSLPDGVKLVVTEADLCDYPGLYLQGTEGWGLTGRFPAVALAEEQTGDRTVKVTRRADILAETAGSRHFPWRILLLAKQDKDLLTHEIVYKLAPVNKLDDTSWIRPGKVAWDWWHANNLFGVDFRAGVNTASYKHYIDFAAEYGIEYIILDEGWYPLGNLLAVSPGMDMEELFAYAKQKGVGIILWVVWKTLEDQLIPALDRFQQWGAKGIKVDFMQRDDQWMVNYYEKVARETAKRHMLVDFHGSYSPKGLRRKYPNVITREGVKGLENCKWSKDITPEHDVTLPFIRLVAGPMDFTPGAMQNAQEKNFSICFERPMSQGTRCHQLAMYVVYESPLQMLADSPSHYRREPACMEFLRAVPTVWDQTVALDAQLADYVVLARRSGNDWYLGAMTDGSARELCVDLSFLDSGTYQADIYADGPNADRYGNDFVRQQQSVTSQDILKIKLAPGGGWVSRLQKK